MRKLFPILVIALALPALTASKWFPTRAEMNDESAAKATAYSAPSRSTIPRHAGPAFRRMSVHDSA